ncbi:MAG: ChrR family anti-sigma-E factor [Paracoccaceae bacterium]
MEELPLKHHLPDGLLAAYSAGSLPEAFSLVVATHVSLCDECRAALAGHEAVGGAVLEDMDLAEIDENSLAATMARIKNASQLGAKPARPMARSIFPAPLADYVNGGPDKVRWRSVGAGVKQAILPCSGGATARLLYIPAGAAMPDHSHRGLELTMVLQGAFADEVDRFARGDVEVGTEHLTHTPIAEAGEDCICLAATDAPLRFKGLLPRLAQPFFRI